MKISVSLGLVWSTQGVPGHLIRPGLNNENKNKTKQKLPNKETKHINALKILRAAHAIPNTQAEWAEPDSLVP